MGQHEALALGTWWSQPLWHRFRAGLRMGAGRLDEAAVEADAGLRAAERSGALALGASLLAISARLAVHRTEIEPALSYLARARQIVADGHGGSTGEIALALALYQDCNGDPAAAVRTLGDVLTMLPRRLLLFAEEPGAAPRIVRIALRGGDTRAAEKGVAAISRLARMNPGIASVTAAAAHAEGLLTGDPALLRTAVRRYRDSPRELDRASALEDAGAADGRAGRRETAAGYLAEAAELYARCGATRDADRATRRLDGLDRRTTPTRRGACGPKAGWESLTAAELRVVELVVTGMRNREVANRLHLSPHTVDTHLRHVFAKLGISSRIQLAHHALSHAPPQDHEKT